MKTLYIALIISLLVGCVVQPQDSFRKTILEDLSSKDYVGCINKIEENLTLVNTNKLLTFNEYWTINHLCKSSVLLSDFYKQKSLRPLNRIKSDSLATIIYSLVKENEQNIKNTIDEKYKNKTEHTINELFLNLMLSKSDDSIKNFKEKRDKIVEENMNNEQEYPDSLFNLIQYQEIRNKLMASGSFELKKYSDQIFYGDNKLIKRNYGLSFSLSAPRFNGAILMGYSFDINLIESFDQKFYLFRNNKYYLPEYSDTSSVKMTVGLTWSIGLLLVNNQKFNSSVSGFMSGFTYENDKGYACAGISLVSNVYFPKYHQIRNINGCLQTKKAIKISINYDFINKQASLGIGISLNKITQINFINTNSLF